MDLTRTDPSLGFQPPPEKMVGVGLGGLTTKPEMGQVR